MLYQQIFLKEDYDLNDKYFLNTYSCAILDMVKESEKIEIGRFVSGMGKGMAVT